MFATMSRRNRRRFQPTFEGLADRIAPSVYLPPVDTTLDDGILMEIGDDGEVITEPDGQPEGANGSTG